MSAREICGGQLLRARRQPLEGGPRAKCRSDQLGDALLRLREGVLGLDAVLLDRLLDVAAASLQLTLDAVAGRAGALGRLATSLAAAALELVELAGDLRADALQLPVAGLAAGPRLDDLGDSVAGDQRGADRNVERTLGTLPNDREGAVAGLGDALTDLRRVGAARGRWSSWAWSACWCCWSWCCWSWSSCCWTWRWWPLITSTPRWIVSSVSNFLILKDVQCSKYPNRCS